MALNFPMTQGKIPYAQMTMSLLHGILLTSLNDDVISGMHTVSCFQVFLVANVVTMLTLITKRASLDPLWPVYSHVE
jgi:hypothetical protein